MGLTVNSNLTTPTGGEADLDSDWTGTDTPANQTTFFRESTQCLGYGTSESDDDSYITISSTNFGSPPGKTLFGWMLIGVPGSPAAVGFGLLMGDGTNDRVYGVGGNTNFGHFVNGWAGFRLDGEQAGAPFRSPRGGAPDLTAVTRIGYGWNYPIAALGKVDSCFHDVIRYIQNGDAALTITDGSPGDPGTWADIAADDASTANGKAYGVCRTLIAGSKAYELTYGIEFGSPTANSYFSDDNFQLVIQGENMTAGNMDIDLILGSPGTDYFSLQDGVIVGIGTAANWDMSVDMDTLRFNRITCTDLGTISFPSSGGTLRESNTCTFNSCGQVSIGTNFTLTGALFNGTTDANGALLLDNNADDTNISDLTFISDGTGHAIYITATGDYTLTNFSYTGYGSPETTNATIYNNSGGPVTITKSGGDTPTIRNGSLSTTTLVLGTVDVTVTATTTLGSPIENARVHLEASGSPALFPDGASVTASAVTTTASIVHTTHGMSTGDKVVIRGANQDAYNGVHSITVGSPDGYTYTMSSSPVSPATGTITSTFVILNDLTDASGIATTNREYSGDQAFRGRVRKASGIPNYKSSPVIGTVDSADGFSTTAPMILDD